MCGIAGMVAADPAAPLRLETLLAMRDALAHRGPDDAGYYLGQGVGLGSRRLSIIDLSSRGRMPMSTEDGRYWIVYNGEVYNFRELRRPLEAKGIQFHSGTDTEVLLHLYAAEGPAMLEKLNGMFALAIWDNQERSLFLARDRLGIKPLCYAWHQDFFYFASEQKALLAGGVASGFDPAAWEELLCFRYVSGENTSFVGIRRLLPGHFMLWQDGRVRTRRWWCLAERAAAAKEASTADWVQAWGDLFESAVSYRRISDVPLGVFLSGGLDSSSIAASLSRQAGAGVESFNMRFAQPEFDEGPLAEQVAQRWGLKNHPLQVNPAELFALLEKAARFNDEPLAHGNELFLYAIAAYAKPRVTVLLSGEGADETLGGYVRYRPLRYAAWLPALQSWLPFILERYALHRRLRKLGAFLDLKSVDQFILYNACDVLPKQLQPLGFQAAGNFPYRQAVLEEAKGYCREPVRQAMYLDHHTFLSSELDRIDRMTMAASIECRVPFLDYRLVEMAANMPTRNLFHRGQGKWVVRRAMKAALPASILRHRKWGFGVPWADYLRSQAALRQMVMDLPAQEPVCSGPFDLNALRAMVAGFMQGSDESYLLLLQLLRIVLWHRVVFQS